MNSPLRVLHVTTGMGEGGAEAMMSRLIMHSDPAIVRHSLLALSHQGPLWEPTRRHCEAALNLRLEKPFAALPKIASLRSFVRGSQPDVVHGWMYHGNLAAAWLRRWLAPKASLVLGIRQSLYDIRHERPLTQRVIRSGAHWSQQADAVVYNSAVSRQHHEAAGYAEDRGRVIANGFDTRRFTPDAGVRLATRTRLGLEADQFAVGMVGRFHAVKDHTTFLRAADLLTRAVPRTRIFIAGPGCTTDNRELAGLVSKHAGAARVELLGAWSGTETLYPALDALCLSSRAEGFPNAVGEAMACGVVCVCTNVGDVPLLVGDAGFLSPVADPDALAAHLVRVAGYDAPGRQEASLAARERILQKFGLDRAIEEYLQVFLGSRRTR